MVRTGGSRYTGLAAPPRRNIHELSLLEKEEILGEIEYLKKDVSGKRYEKLRDTVFRIASAGEEAGFIRGFRYAVNLLMECME